MKLTRILATSLLTLGASAVAASAQTELRLATMAPPNTPWMALMESWAANVAENSGGELTVSIYHSGQLGNEFDTARQTQRGRIDIINMSGSALTELVPAIALMSTPFMFDSEEVLDCVYDGEFGDRLIEVIEAQGFRFLQWGETGWIYLAAQDDLTDVADAAGYRVRVAPHPISRLIWNSVGAQGVEVHFAEAPAALQTGMIRGSEAAGLSMLGFGLHQAAPHIHELRHNHQAGAMLLSARTAARLSEAEMQILRDSLLPIDEVRGAVRTVVEGAMAQYAEAGGPFHQLTDEQRAAWADMITPNWPDFVADLDETAQDMWDDLLAARDACGG